MNYHKRKCNFFTKNVTFSKFDLSSREKFSQGYFDFMVVIFTEFIYILKLNKEEFFGMSSDDVELFLFGTYGVSAFKCTIKRVFSTISTSQLIPNMSIMWILDF